MKTLIVWFFFIGLAHSLTFAQSQDEKDVASAVEKLRKAMIDGDKDVLQSLTMDDLSYGHSSGAVEDKKVFMESIVSGKNDFQKIDQTEQTIKISGKIAIVRHKFKAEMLINGNSASPNIGVMQIWQKDRGKWMLLARQAFKL